MRSNETILLEAPTLAAFGHDVKTNFAAFLNPHALPQTPLTSRTMEFTKAQAAVECDDVHSANVKEFADRGFFHGTTSSSFGAGRH